MMHNKEASEKPRLESESFSTQVQEEWIRRMVFKEDNPDPAVLE